MDSKKIIPKGNIAKYQLIIRSADFDAAENDVFAILHYGMMGATKRISKNEMFTNEDGDIFVFFDTANMTGEVKAETHYVVSDGDMSGGTREEIDYQIIGFVTDAACPQFCKSCKCNGGGDEQQVEWVRKQDSDLSTVFLYLRTRDKEPILDSEGKPLRVRKQKNK